MRVVNRHTFRHALHASGHSLARKRQMGFIVSMLLLSATAAWSWWPIILSVFHAWWTDADYSAGQLVPLLAIFFIWRDKKSLGKLPLVPCWSGGLALLVLAAAVRFYGLLSGAQPSIGRYSLILVVAALILLVAGWQVFRRVFWILLFLFLMFPLPGVVDSWISLPLQRVATTGAVFLLEACGITVGQQGNIVVLNGETPLEVAEACSGLRMLIAFVIAAAFIAYLVQRPRWQKAVLLVSSIPVAVICNVIRIFLTALLMLYLGSDVGQKFFHDIGGFVMIAVAVSLLFGEIRLLDRLIVSDSETQTPPLIVSARPAAKGYPKAATR